ncbi:MAG: hypothetical protein NVS1B11_11540 [Terriglobales bacterium]
MRTQFEHLPQKSGSPSVKEASRQFIAFASIRDNVYFPHPGGPAITIACGK